MELDASNTEAVARVIKAEKVDTVMNCAWYQTNLAVMGKRVLDKGGAHYTDLGGFFDTCLKQLEHDKAWRDAGLNATIGLGSTPGRTNVAGAAGSAKLDTVDTINIYCAWGNTLPVKEPGWPGYSIRTVLDEFTQEPVMWLDGKHVKQPVLSGETTVTMQEPIGKDHRYYVKHSEPATWQGTSVRVAESHVSNRLSRSTSPPSTRSEASDSPTPKGSSLGIRRFRQLITYL